MYTHVGLVFFIILVFVFFKFFYVCSSVYILPFLTLLSHCFKS